MGFGWLLLRCEWTHLGDVWGVPGHWKPWEDGKELSWPWGAWHHVHSVAGVRPYLGCWAWLRDGCWMQEWNTLWETALPGCWSRAVPPGTHFSPLHGCLGQVAFHHLAVRFCRLVCKGLLSALLEALCKAERTWLSGSMPHPSHKFFHSMQAP